jgi:hypothetical protein
MGHSGTGTTILLVLIILMVIGFSIPTVRNGVSVIMITIAAVIYMIIISAAFAFWLLMLIDCLKRPTERIPNRGESDKLIWCLAILLFSLISGALTSGV